MLHRARFRRPRTEIFTSYNGIAAAVLGRPARLRGGEGSIVGIVLGTILLQILQNLVNLLEYRVPSISR